MENATNDITTLLNSKTLFVGEERGEGLWELIFLQNIKPSPFGELTNCMYWRRVLAVCEDLYFKFNICCYNNILKIKNINHKH